MIVGTTAVGFTDRTITVRRPVKILLTIGLAGFATAMVFVALSEAVAPNGMLHAAANRMVGSARHKIEQIKAADSSLPDVQFGVYGGGSHTRPSQVTLNQPGGTDMAMEDVGWSSGVDRMPPYHGFRATWWGRNLSAVGSMLDLAYVKVIADRETPTRQTGTRDGTQVPSTEPLSNTFRRLEFTNGLNIFTWNGVVRLPALFGRVRPYFGIGAGLSVPHVEVRRTHATTRTFEFQVAGLAFQVLAGLEWRVRDRFSTFAEYKLSYARNETDLIDGGTLTANLVTNQFVVGASGHLRRPPGAF